MEKLVKRTDPEGRRSVPTEILAEFLTYIMLKNYEMALSYCTEILTYEPENSTAKEFYPLIMKKLEMIRDEELDSLSESSGSDSTYSVSDSSSFKSSSDSSQSDLTLEESEDDSRSSNNFVSQTAESEVGTPVPSTSRNQGNNPAMERKSNNGYQTCTLSAPRLINRTTTRIIKRDGKPTMKCTESSPTVGAKKCKKPQLPAKNNHL